MRSLIVLATIMAPLFAHASCPEPSDTRNELLNLIAKANAARSQAEGRRVSNEMWQVWLRAPDEAAQTVLDAGMARRDVYDFAGAIAEYNRLVDYCPTYAEGYNQRAYIHFLNGNHEAALTDLDMTISLQPYHVAAQSGRALTLMNLGRINEARDQLLIAVDNNPWLSERALLADDAPLGLQGKSL
ncbi:TPR domain protein [Sulfitobacter noctilucicola]|uniref:Tetratricopeptide (TPR) repeat protein n=1 Tax=Sulfitobacter noctilucicola TaxID=1342301 RepID=A0A7W6Q4H4_9RHOB|nr:hypothetical protein [Sulfitobacter noctilucicola]KIN63921.1 TPR domain protein [Sulfitobacter noctilucicola]MBB4175280.1 tetratricopeptide (TPR) repeat protein [Sulfitobacter noctilucicola]